MIALATTYDNNTKDASGKSINDYKTAYAEAAARGDAAGMKAANDAANAIRTANGGTAEVAHDAISKVASGKTYSVEQQRSMGFDTGNAGRTGSTGAARANAAAGSSAYPTLESYSNPHTYVPSGNVSASIKTQDPSVVMRRNPALAGQTVNINGYNVTFNEDGYARSAVNVDKTGAQKAQSLEAAYGTDRSGYGGSDKDKYYFSDAELQDADYWRQQAQAGNISWAQANDMVNRTRNKYGYAEYYSTGGNETDYSALIKEAIRSGADADAVAGLIAQRNAKIDGNPALEQYRNDDTYRLAMDYISTQQAGGRSDLEAQLLALYGQGGSLDAAAEAERQAKIAAVEAAIEHLNAQKSDLNDSYDALERQLYINREKNQKNIQQQMAAAGLTGGAAESTLLGLRTDYEEGLRQGEQERARAIGEIERGITDARLSGDLDAATTMYNRTKENLDSYAQALQILMQQENVRAQQEREDRAAEQSRAYALALSLLEGGVMPSGEMLSMAGIDEWTAQQIKGAANAANASSAYRGTTSTPKKPTEGQFEIAMQAAAAGSTGADVRNVIESYSGLPMESVLAAYGISQGAAPAASRGVTAGRLSSGEAMSEAARAGTTASAQVAKLIEFYNAGQITEQQLRDLQYAILNPSK